MKHEKALAIRTLTEAMHNAHNVSDYRLVDQLRAEISAMLAPVQQEEELLMGEAGAPEPESQSNELTDNDHAVLGFLDGNCPCCVIFGVLVAGDELPLGDEEFIYTLGAGAGYNQVASTIQAVAEKAQEYFKTLGASQARDVFALRFNGFTVASIAARNRLAADGHAPALPEHVVRLNEALGPLVQQMAERVRSKLH